MPSGPLPSSGQISLRAISSIKGYSLSNRSLATLAVTDLNPYSPSYPGATSPHIISSWYNYAHGTKIDLAATYNSNGSVILGFTANYGRITAYSIDYSPSWASSTSAYWSDSGMNDTSFSEGTAFGGGGHWYNIFSPSAFQFATYSCSITCTFGESSSTVLNLYVVSTSYYLGSGTGSASADSNQYTL